jgi:hypothetical protein
LSEEHKAKISAAVSAQRAGMAPPRFSSQWRERRNQQRRERRRLITTTQ